MDDILGIIVRTTKLSEITQLKNSKRIVNIIKNYADFLSLSEKLLFNKSWLNNKLIKSCNFKNLRFIKLFSNNKMDHLHLTLVKTLIKEQNIEAIKFLIDKTPEKQSLLLAAINIGNLEIFKILFDKYRINVREDKDFASEMLLLACKGSLDIVKFLIEKNADLEAYNNSAITFASSYGNVDIVSFLVEKNANIHAQDEAPLSLAATNKNFEVVKLLLDHGAHISEALLNLMQKYHPGMYDYLLSKGLGWNLNQDF
jgi:ankyrin repeat protein